MNLEVAQDQDVVIIGGAGDLSRRKLLPALYNLFLANALPRNGLIIGSSRRTWSDADFRNFAAESLREFSRTEPDEKSWSEFSKRLVYVPASGESLADVEARCTQERRLIYLAVPPDAFELVTSSLHAANLTKNGRVVIEKPFGHDLESARELNRCLHHCFSESQIFRIDHYLGKENVQNIIVFRFANSVFERVWNRDAIDHVEITVAESIGMEGRGDFYEDVGALRDIIQNHVLQVLSLLTMEPPAEARPEAIRDEKAKLLKAVRPFEPKNVIRGQYTAGTVDGKQVPGYREEPGVSSTSNTETFIALKTYIDNWRWAGVPFFLRTGKRLPYRATEIEIAFKETPLRFFEQTKVDFLRPNHITLCIQPEEEIRFAFLTKVPGPEVDVKPVHMGFSYENAFMVEPQEAYERLMHDAMQGDHTLFVREDSVDRAWALVEPLLDNPPPLYSYPAGTWGPEEAAAIIAPEQWHLR